MNKAVFLLYLINLVLIGLLPKVFFRKDGRFNLMWWVTALPFFLCALFLLLAMAGYIPAFVLDGWREALEIISVPPGVASIALIFYTLGTHRIPIALWHQENDAPAHIVTYGAYRRIRHPFYASFILGLLGAFIFFPHPGTLYTFLHGLVVLNITAAKEEKRLSASEFGAEYKQYIQRTGRFLPRFSTGQPADTLR
jgi:protein-S-isoprenylcysteine O-methyltransferase Ste14